MKSKPLISLVMATVMITLFLAACSKQQQPPVRTQPSNVTVGIARFTQPMSTADLLAGTLPEDYPTINPKVLLELDQAFDATLSGALTRPFVHSNVSVACEQGISDKNTGMNSAMRYWVAVGKCMGVDLILVPMLMHWEERDGGQAGVVRPASVILDFFLIDTRDATLVSRIRYDETQAALTDNLLDINKFVRRGGRWVTATDLAREGMNRAIKSMGL